MYSELIKDVQNNGDKYTPESVAKRILDIAKYKSSDKPVPIVDIVNRMGFHIILVDELPNDDSGIIMIDPSLEENFGSTKCVAITKKIKYGKRRFVLAHEIAHYLFDFNNDTKTNYISSYNASNLEEDNEIKANKFAASLLMPENMFVDEFRKMKHERELSLAEIIVDLSKVFETTTKSVERRIDELSLLEGAL